jgi:hypothetical protein
MAKTVWDGKDRLRKGKLRRRQVCLVESRRDSPLAQGMSEKMESEKIGYFA